jgi:hypothetical protein
MSTLSSALLKLLQAGGLSTEQIIEVAEQMEADTMAIRDASAFLVDDRSPGAIRQARYRKRNAERNEERNETHNGDAPSLDNKGLPHTPSKQLNPPKENPPKGGQKKGNALPADWQPTPADLEYGRNLGLADRAVTEAAEDMRQWADANSSRDVARKSNWSAAFKGWLRREAEKKGQHGSKAEENKRRELLRSQFY